MGDWPASSGARVDVAGAVTGSSSGTTVTSSVSLNTKGSWTQLIASTPFACSALMLIASYGTSSHLLDIGVGGSGSEQILIPDIHYSGVNVVPQITVYPVRIPEGSRIAARLASAASSNTTSLTAYLIGGGFDGASARSCVKTYGAVTADSGGTSVDPGATLHTKGAWSQITASTTAVTKGMIIDIGNQNNTVATAATWLFDIGVGGAGSEQVLIPNYRVSASVNETIQPAWSPVIPVDIPEGSRLAVRSQCNITDATDRLLDVVLHGIT